MIGVTAAEYVVQAPQARSALPEPAGYIGTDPATVRELGEVGRSYEKPGPGKRCTEELPAQHWIDSVRIVGNPTVRTGGACSTRRGDGQQGRRSGFPQARRKTEQVSWDPQSFGDLRDLLERGDAALAPGESADPLGLDVARFGDLRKADSAPLAGKSEDRAEVVLCESRAHIVAIQDMRW
ncbi:hypothetical protein [Peterkaempfera bronchialis]|uniref:hypothetical protein n=1 Tax=Peterkaempfera bronchialis TaxID=2126346 RepID=UPI003C2C9C1C